MKGAWEIRHKGHVFLQSDRRVFAKGKDSIIRRGENRK